MRDLRPVITLSLVRPMSVVEELSSAEWTPDGTVAVVADDGRQGIATKRQLFVAAKPKKKSPKLEFSTSQGVCASSSSLAVAGMAGLHTLFFL